MLLKNLDLSGGASNMLVNGSRGLIVRIVDLDEEMWRYQEAAVDLRDLVQKERLALPLSETEAGRKAELESYITTFHQQAAYLPPHWSTFVAGYPDSLKELNFHEEERPRLPLARGGAHGGRGGLGGAALAASPHLYTIFFHASPLHPPPPVPPSGVLHQRPHRVGPAPQVRVHGAHARHVRALADAAQGGVGTHHPQEPGHGARGLLLPRSVSSLCWLHNRDHHPQEPGHGAVGRRGHLSAHPSLILFSLFAGIVTSCDYRPRRRVHGASGSPLPMPMRSGGVRPTPGMFLTTFT